MPNTNDDDNKDDGKNTDGEQLTLEEKAKKLADEQLAEIKKKLDAAYAARDEALRKAQEAEEAKRKAEIERLEAEGKHKEALEAKLAEEKARVKALEEKNLQLSRDSEVRRLLSTLPFRNSAAQEMAFREIVMELVQDSNGAWVHKSGSSLSNYIEAFSKDSEKEFLFKAKNSSGAGTNNSGGSGNGTEHKSLFKMSQAEVLKLAAEGKLPGKK